LEDIQLNTFSESIGASQPAAANQNDLPASDSNGARAPETHISSPRGYPCKSQAAASIQDPEGSVQGSSYRRTCRWGGYKVRSEVWRDRQRVKTSRGRAAEPTARAPGGWTALAVDPRATERRSQSSDRIPDVPKTDRRRWRRHKRWSGAREGIVI